MSKKTNTVKKAANMETAAQKPAVSSFVHVRSKLPFDLSFDFNGKTCVIRGRKQAQLVKAGNLILPYQENIVPSDVWEYFLKIYGDKPFIKNKIIFAEDTSAKADDEAKELSKDSSTLTGMEQVNPLDVPGIKKAEDVEQTEGLTV